MKNSQHHLKALALLSLTATCLCAVLDFSFNPAHAQQAPSNVWITTAAEQLRSAQGTDWINARNAALACPNIERQTLLTWLNRPDGSAADRTAALILQARLEHPAVAQDYDNAVARSLSDPEIGRHGGPIYNLTMPKLTEVSYPLAMELFWKRSDLPSGLRWGPMIQMHVQIPYVEPMLVVLGENPGMGGEMALALTTMAKAHPDPRVVPALVNNYRYARGEKPNDRGHAHRIMALTAMLETPEAAAAVLQMREIERSHAQAHGWTPWNDADAEEDLRLASQSRAQAKHNRSRPGSEEILTQAQNQYQEALERKQRRWLWEQIEKSVNDLRAKDLITNP